MTKPPILTLLARGARKTCPKCGEGDVLTGYLKQVVSCSACGETFNHIQADDAPPWLTIMVVGHIMISLVMALETNFKIPMAWEISGVVVISAILTGILLPICKGIVIAVMWNVVDKASKDQSVDLPEVSPKNPRFPA